MCAAEGDEVAEGGVDEAPPLVDEEADAPAVDELIDAKIAADERGAGKTATGPVWSWCTAGTADGPSE